MRKKSFQLIALVAVAALALVGCAAESKDPGSVRLPADRQEVLANGFLTYLSDKYGKEFEPVPIDNPDIITRPDMLIACEKGASLDRNCVTVYKAESNGVPVYSDNYFGVLIRPEYEARISTYAQNRFPNAKVYITGYAETVFDSSLNLETSLDDVITAKKCPTASVCILAKLSSEDMARFDSAVSSVAKDIGAAGIPCSIKVYGVSADTFNAITYENLAATIPDDTVADGENCLAIKSVRVTL